MADEQHSDEQRLYKAFQELANVLLPLEQELRERAVAMLGPFLGIATPNTSLTDAGGTRPVSDRSLPTSEVASPDAPSPKDFLFEKQPTTDVERVACLAYYLSRYRGVTHFKTVDISKLNTEAAQRKFANTAHSVGNATRDGYLATVSRGMKQLAAEGERYVEELPDRAAAKAAFRARKARRPRRQSNAGKRAPAT